MTEIHGYIVTLAGWGLLLCWRAINTLTKAKLCLRQDDDGTNNEESQKECPDSDSNRGSSDLRGRQPPRKANHRHALRPISVKGGATRLTGSCSDALTNYATWAVVGRSYLCPFIPVRHTLSTTAIANLFFVFHKVAASFNDAICKH